MKWAFLMLSVVLATQGCESAGGGRSADATVASDALCALPAAHLPGAVCDTEHNTIWLANGDNPACAGSVFGSGPNSGPVVWEDRCTLGYCEGPGSEGGGCSKDGAYCAPSCATSADCPASAPTCFGL